MDRIPGPITDRLPVDSDAWTYHRDEEQTDARAADGYRLGNRWRAIRRRRLRALGFQVAALTVFFALGLALYAGVEQYAERRYDAPMDRSQPPWCYVERPAEGPRCHGVDRIGDLP